MRRSLARTSRMWIQQSQEFDILRQSTFELYGRVSPKLPHDTGVLRSRPARRIGGLKLDADWAILSAWNTAAGGAQGAEALSGLARVFFYAGARSLSVSHWEVASDSTVCDSRGELG